MKTITKLTELQQKEYDRLVAGWKEKHGDKVDPKKLELIKEHLPMMDTRGDCKKLVTVMGGKTYLVPIVDMMLHGLDASELGKRYTEEITPEE